MSISVGVEYALHCLIYLAIPTTSRSIGIKEMAAFQGISETYLSKIFMKLRKKGLVSAVPGVKGGYRLSREADEITFWDVVEAIEAPLSVSMCRNQAAYGHCGSARIAAFLFGMSLPDQ